jgi:hypothetical protein
MVADRISQGGSRSRRGSPRACGGARRRARAGVWLIMAGLLGLAACDGPVDPPPPPPPGLFVLSDPGFAPAAAGVSHAPGAGAQTDVVHVSLPAGAVAEGRLAIITNGRTGATARTAMADGGFDPVPLLAEAGDAVAVEIQLSGSTSPMQLSYVVPIRRRPIVIRMDPPPRKRDIVLNAPIRIVFSEPVDRLTIDGGTVRLLRNGVAVSGRVNLSADGLRAEFQPDQLLVPNADYVLSVASGVADVTGDSLESAVAAEFTTGTTTAVATAYTDPAALYVVTSYEPLNGLLRTAEFEAILHDDGRVTGRYTLFYPERGWTNSGSISCFSIAGDTAWIGGLTEEATKTDQIGKHVAWFAVDNARIGVADQLSLAWVGLPSGEVGTVQDHCDEQPRQLEVQNVETGDVVVIGETPPAPPRPQAAHLMFTRQPEDAIMARPITPVLYVRALDATRTRTGDFAGSVSISLATNPGGGELTGTLTATAEAGLAMFDDLRVSAPGAGYALIASAPGLSSDTSDAFDVVEVGGGAIAFHDSGGIWVMNSDGSGLRTLIDDVADGAFSHTNPAWSPDGTQIAFSSARGGNRDIYVMNTDGSGVTRLTDHPEVDDSPDWSPDGEKIVFTSSRGGGWFDIYEMNPDGSGVNRLTNDPAFDLSPVWSPDGSRIAFASDRDAPSVAVVPPVQGALEIYEMNADGSGITRLTDTPGTNPEPGAGSDRPAWSPDGSKILYQKSAPDPGVYVINSDGSGATVVTIGGGAPFWSPDGQRIVYSARFLYVMNADGSQIVNLNIEGYEPAWSPR